MKLKWIGHSCFLFETSTLRILIDPYRAGAYDGAIGYRPVLEQVDLVLLTHDHPDHSGETLLPGNPLIVRGPATARNVVFETLNLPHDAEQGKLRGWVRAFLFELENIRIAHLSDLGDKLSLKQIEALKGTQVLLIPVGGLYTIDGPTAWRICQEIQPKLIIPMHFKTSRVSMPLDSVNRFLEAQSKVRQVSYTTLNLDKDSLPESMMTVVLTPAN